MPTTGTQLVNACVDLYEHDQPQWYSQQDPRCDPSETHHADCTGGMCWAMAVTGAPHDWPGSGFCSNSWLMAQECHRLGLGIPLEEARWTPGAAGWIGANEGQTNIDSRGHGFYFVGDGVHTFEWRGRSAGLGIFTISSHEVIDWCSHLPGIQYGGATPAPVPIPKKKERPMGMVEMPRTDQTPVGRAATAIANFDDNRVELNDGARCVGDHAIAGQPHTHYWRPPQKDWIPGWSIQDVCRSESNKNILIVRYTWGENNGGTYILQKLGGTKLFGGAKTIAENPPDPDHPEAKVTA